MLPKSSTPLCRPSSLKCFSHDTCQIKPQSILLSEKTLSAFSLQGKSDELLFIYLFIFRQVVPLQELEADRTAPPPDPPAAEPGPENQDTADPETEATQNPSREFLKFTNQALELKVRRQTLKIRPK